MDLKELKEKHPDLVKALADEVTAKVKPEIEAALAKQYEEKVLAKIGEEKDAIREAVEKEVAEKFHVAAMLEALEAIAVAVAPFAGPEDDKDKVPAADAALKATVDQLQKELNKVGQGLKEAQEREAKLLADLEAAKVPAYIGEKVKAEQGAELLAEELRDCRSTQQVDERLPAAKAKVKRLLEMLPALPGRGKVHEERQDDDGLTPQQRRERRLAGVRD